VKPKTAFDAIALRLPAEKVWHVLDSLPPLKGSKANGSATPPTPPKPAAPKGPTLPEQLAAVNDARAKADQFLNEMPRELNAQWSAEVEAQLDADRVPDHLRATSRKAMLRMRAAREIGVKV